jgi:filamentous hemagglutinin family protein
MNRKITILPSCLGLFLVNCYVGDRVFAQIAPDNTLGQENSVFDPNTGAITGGATRGQNRTNLFHSFDRFNIPSESTADFRPEANIKTIFSRVTGTDPSIILGTLRVTGGANLFFINPRGIVFGSGAQLDTQGAFVATTANSIKFPDGTQFGTNNPQGAPLLTIDTPTPIGLEFAGVSPGAIINAGTLETTGAENNISFIGGTIINTGSIDTSTGNGDINLITVPSGVNSVVNVDNNGIFQNKSSLSLTQTESSGLGLRELVEIAEANLANTGLSIDPQTQEVIGIFDTPIQSGDIFISSSEIGTFYLATGDSGSLILDSSKNINLINNDIASISNNSLQETIKLIANDSITLKGTAIYDTEEDSAIDISLTANNINLSDQSYISTENSTGNINLIANNDINLNDQSYISTENSIGNINLIANNDINLNDGNYIYTENSLSSINLTANNINLDNGSYILTQFNEINKPVNINITARNQILLSNEASVKNTNNDRETGDINLQAGQKIGLINTEILTGGISDNSPGNVTLNSPHIEFDNSSLKSQSTLDIAQKNLTLEFDSLLLNNKSSIYTNIDIPTVTGINAANINLKPRSNFASVIYLKNFSQVYSQALDGQNNGGDINIQTGKLEVYDGSKILSERRGNVTIDAKESVLVSGLVDGGNPSQIAVNSYSILGIDEIKSGKLVINTDRLKIENAGQINTEISSNSSNGNFKAGDIEINANSIFLNRGEIQANVIGLGNSGEINIKARDSINLDNSKITTIVSTGGIGSPGKIFIETGNLRLSNTSFISTEVEKESTANQPGSIDLKINNLDLNNSKITANTFGNGDAGNINITAFNNINLANRSKVSTAVESGANGRGGEINISARTLNVTGGSRIETTTATDNSAGNLHLNINRKIVLDGDKSGLFANTISRGSGGNIFVDPTVFLIQNNAGIFVNSEGTGRAGNIEVFAGSLTLNRGIISAKTLNSDGGNITLNIPNLLLLRNGSQISTTAGTNQSGGNGGNIAINSRFVIANPTEDSDILANAFSGNGGNIRLNANGIFGFQIQDNFRFNAANNSLENPTPGISEIVASSQFGSQGTIEIITLQTDPLAGLETLPETTVNLQVTQGCIPRTDRAKAEYFYLGRTGLADSPERLFSEEVTPAWTSWYNSNQNLESNTRSYSVEPILASSTLNTIQSNLPCQ